MKATTAKLLEKAARSLQAAEHLTKTGDSEFAVSRAYYTMFYSVQALLNEKELRFRKHAGVHSAFAERFVKNGLMDKKYHRWLLVTFNKRLTADYGIDAELSSEDAKLSIRQAVYFLQAAKEFLVK